MKLLGHKKLDALNLKVKFEPQPNKSSLSRCDKCSHELIALNLNIVLVLLDMRSLEYYKIQTGLLT